MRGRPPKANGVSQPLAAWVFIGNVPTTKQKDLGTLSPFPSIPFKRLSWMLKWMGETRRPDRLILHILPPRWATSRIVDCMQALYLNSEFFPVSERFDFFPSKARDHLVRIEGPRILVGGDPHLFASKVSDLRTERDKNSGAQTVRWTQPSGITRSSRGERQYHGQPIERGISTDGDISQLKTQAPRK